MVSSEPTGQHSLLLRRLLLLLQVLALTTVSSLMAQMLKNLPTVLEDPGSIPGLGRSSGDLLPPGEGNGLPTPVFLPGEFHGQRSLVGYSLWGHKELDMTGRLTLSLFIVSSKSQCLLKRQIFAETEFIFSFLGGTQTPSLTCHHLRHPGRSDTPP